jgi:hypothetical protein
VPVLHFAAKRRALLAVGTAACAVIVAAMTACGGSDSRRTPGERARTVVREAADRRSCTERRDFTVYTLGERFNGEDATRFGAQCETHTHQVEVFYGPCRDGGESGCGNDISVRSAPACEHRYLLYTKFSGPPGPELITLRGVPASVLEERIELWTRDTSIIIFADPAVARRAVDALRPAPRATATGAPLPKPAVDITNRELSDIDCQV